MIKVMTMSDGQKAINRNDSPRPEFPDGPDIKKRSWLHERIAPGDRFAAFPTFAA
jgi:hypothetical protein